MPYGTDTIDSEIQIRAMSYEEIAEFLRANFDIGVVKGDFNPVNQEKLITVYISMLQTIKPDMNSMQIPFEALASIEIDGHEQYIMLRNVFLSMRQFLGSLRCGDFVFEDVIAPKPKRTQTILSILISFLCFSDSRVEESKQLEIIVNETEKKRNDLASAEPALQRRKNNARVALPMAEENYDTAQKKYENVVAMCYEIAKDKDDTKKENAIKKEKIAMFQQDIKAKIEIITKQQERSNYLESRIACSPEELESTIAERNIAIQRCKLEIQAQKAELLKVSASKTIVDNWKSKIRKTFNIIEAIAEQQKTISSIEATLNNLNYKGKTLRNELAEAQQNLEDQETILKLYREKWNSLMIQHQAQVNAKETALKEAKKNKERLMKHVNEKDIVVESLSNEMEQLELNIKEQEKQLEELSEYPPEYYRLIKGLNIFHEKLHKNIQNVVDAIDNLQPANLPKCSRSYQHKDPSCTETY